MKSKSEKRLCLIRHVKSLASSVLRFSFYQFLFFRQWNALRKYANEKGITIIGDLPIFVAGDSADVWANPELFFLDEYGNPTVVAGVPPDVFSPTGQLWGNPLYRWDEHQRTGYAWWIERVKATLKVVDMIRLDHFRGFAGYYEIPAADETAEHGQWKPGPGADLFHVLRSALGNDLPIIAEDLGVITPDVVAIREEFGLPGMKILQFDSPAPIIRFFRMVMCAIAWLILGRMITIHRWAGWRRHQKKNASSRCVIFIRMVMTSPGI